MLQIKDLTFGYKKNEPVLKKHLAFFIARYHAAGWGKWQRKINFDALLDRHVARFG